MPKSKEVTPKEQKRAKIFDAAADVFAQYGFRRTAMNDIAEAAGVSRPSLYLVFENKESLFRELAAFRQTQAIDQAVLVLSADAALADRVIGAILAYEKEYYEPVAQSPHGAELMDINQSIAGDLMQKGYERLVDSLARALEESAARGEVAFSEVALKPNAYVELLMSSIGGLKKKARSTSDFRRRIKEVAGIFLTAISARRKG